MEIELDPTAQVFVDTAVRTGRFATPSEAVGAGLRLLEEQERAWSSLRQSMQDAIARGGELSDADLDDHLEKVDQRLAAAGL